MIGNSPTPSSTLSRNCSPVPFPSSGNCSLPTSDSPTRSGTSQIDRCTGSSFHKDIRRIADIASFETLFLTRVSRTVANYGKIKLESNEYPVTSSPHNTVVEVRYDPFDLAKVFIFKDGTCIETTSVSKLVNKSASTIPEESKASSQEVSSHAQAYFQALREKHFKTLTANSSPLYYSKLLAKEST